MVKIGRKNPLPKTTNREMPIKWDLFWEISLYPKRQYRKKESFIQNDKSGMTLPLPVSGM